MSRQALAGVQSKVNLRTEVIDLDIQLESLYSEWVLICGKTEDELEEASDPIRPSLIEASFEESGSVLDKVDEVFKGIKAQYPDKQQVIDYLDFVDKPLKEQSKEQANSGGSETVTSGRGDDYVKAKLPKLKKEIETRFKSSKDKFEKEKEELS